MLAEALLCLSVNLYFEARSEGLVGMEAVAEVTMNRADYDMKNVCNVVFQEAQFSWTNRYKKKVKAKDIAKQIPKKNKQWVQAKQIAMRFLNGENTNHVGDATYYFNPKKAKPKWRHSFTKVARIGNHLFFIDRKKKLPV